MNPKQGKLFETKSFGNGKRLYIQENFACVFSPEVEKVKLFCDLNRGARGGVQRKLECFMY
jgi:hypothetical protein